MKWTHGVSKRFPFPFHRAKCSLAATVVFFSFSCDAKLIANSHKSEEYSGTFSIRMSIISYRQCFLLRQIWWHNFSSQFRLGAPFRIHSVFRFGVTSLILNIRGENFLLYSTGSGGRVCKSSTTIWCVIANTEKCQSLQGHLFLCGMRWRVQISGCMEWWNTSHTRRQITTFERGWWEECVCVCARLRWSTSVQSNSH